MKFKIGSTKIESKLTIEDDGNKKDRSNIKTIFGMLPWWTVYVRYALFIVAILFFVWGVFDLVDYIVEGAIE